MTRSRSLVASFLAFLWVFGLALLSGCGESKPSRSEAAKVLETYLARCYGLAVPANLTLTSTSDPRYIHINLARDLELVETNQTTGPHGRAVLEITLTQKGSSTRIFEDIHKNILFLVSENRIDEIVEIVKQPGNTRQFIVSFAYTQSYNELGRKIAAEMSQYGYSWIDDNTKLRGKATMAYDTYLKRYVVQNMVWSEWEQQRWRPAYFVVNANKETALYYSYEHREQLVGAPAAQEPPVNQDRQWEMERRNAERAERFQQQRAEAEKRTEAMRQAQEEHQKEMERQRTSRELRQLEREAEMQRRNQERAEKIQQQREEYERRRTERELNKKLLR
jgi:flagellar biosynthesis GTPase FlhF